MRTNEELQDPVLLQLGHHPGRTALAIDASYEPARRGDHREAVLGFWRPTPAATRSWPPTPPPGAARPRPRLRGDPRRPRHHLQRQPSHPGEGDLGPPAHAVREHRGHPDRQPRHHPPITTGERALPTRTQHHLETPDPHQGRSLRLLPGLVLPQAVRAADRPSRHRDPHLEQRRVPTARRRQSAELPSYFPPKK